MNGFRFQRVPRRASTAAALMANSVMACLLIQCAGQVPPSGGPADAEPPKIVRTSPDSNAVRVEATSIELEFSEYVNRRSVEESIFISPYVGDLEFDWSGTQVTITFPQTLRKNTTYVVNVGTDVSDVRAQNRMASGFTLAFSTGDSIDRGYISGRVFDPKPEGVMVFAYALNGRDADTLDPSRTKPDYIMQTGARGTYTLSNIALGMYRLVAVRDEYRNLLYDKEVDQYGVLPRDLTLDARHEREENVWFRLSREDTTKPFLSSVTASDRYTVVAHFSETIDSVSFGHARFAVTDTLTGQPAAIRVGYLSRANPAVATFVMQTPLSVQSPYRLSVFGLADLSGNLIDSTNASAIFLGSDTPDTLKPMLAVAALRDSARDIPPDQVLELRFSKAVSHPQVEKGVVLFDSLRTPVACKLIWLNATDMALTPASLNNAAWYRLEVIMDSVRDFQGNGYRDSTFVLRFQTRDPRTTGTVEGKVVDLQSGGQGDIYLTGQGVDTGISTERTIRLPTPGPFAIEHLPEGKYLFRAFRDADGSSTYSYGQPFPYHPSERFALFPDTVRVRARWDVEGVVITFH
jgi:hypothetical protein